MQPKLQCSVTDEHETKLEIVQDADHRAELVLGPDEVEALITGLAECRAENPKPTAEEKARASQVIEAEFAVR